MTRRVALFVLAALVLGAAPLISLVPAGRAQPAPKPNPEMQAVADAAGTLRVPPNYRSNYDFLGSWAVAANQGQGSKQLHFVYASPGTAAAYRRSGHFPDGTLLVKEVYQTATSSMTTGTVSRAQTLEGWFVMVRDSKNIYPDNKLWGSGWGWSWFDAANPVKTTSTDYSRDCQSCHVPAKQTDWIYTSGYPVLRN
jgi:Cytochrome P460